MVYFYKRIVFKRKVQILKIERYRQIAAELATEIEAGVYPKGQLFPRRSELAERFGVTRTTVNRAMDILQEKGFIAARRGSGTVVINTRQRYDIAYIAPEWLIRYMPSSAGCNLEYLSYEDALGTQSQVAKLTRFDGILWSHPDEPHIPRIIDYQGKLPGIIINRAVPECNYVATEYCEYFREQVAARLRAVPNAVPYLLSSSEGNRFVHARRLEGFIAACRDEQRFYELIEMQPEFNKKLDALDTGIKHNPGKRLLIFADDWSHTGALVQWALRRGLKWKKDLFYIDFDNTEHRHVWGIKTTSIIQDFDLLSIKALETLKLLIREPERSEQLLIPPTIRYADT